MELINLEVKMRPVHLERVPAEFVLTITPSYKPMMHAPETKTASQDTVCATPAVLRVSANVTDKHPHLSPSHGKFCSLSPDSGGCRGSCLDRIADGGDCSDNALNIGESERSPFLSQHHACASGRCFCGRCASSDTKKLSGEPACSNDVECTSGYCKNGNSGTTQGCRGTCLELFADGQDCSPEALSEYDGIISNFSSMLNDEFSLDVRWILRGISNPFAAEDEACRSKSCLCDRCAISGIGKLPLHFDCSNDSDCESRNCESNFGSTISCQGKCKASQPNLLPNHEICSGDAECTSGRCKCGRCAVGIDFRSRLNEEACYDDFDCTSNNCECDGWFCSTVDCDGQGYPSPMGTCKPDRRRLQESWAGDGNFTFVGPGKCQDKSSDLYSNIMQ